MSTELSGSTHPRITDSPPLKLRSIFAFGGGVMGMGLFITPTALLLLFYFTEVAGISAAAAGTIFLLMRAIDALVDLPLGMMIDRIKTRAHLGKFRRWLVIAAIPLLLVNLALYSIPELDPTGTLIWAYVAYGLFGVVYSVVDISLGSLSAAMTQEPRDRARLGSARSIASLVTGTLISAIVLPQLTPDADLRATFSVVVLVLGLLGVALLLLTAFTTRERVVRSEKPVSTRESLRMLRSNRPLFIIAITALLLFTGNAGASGATAYYMRDVMDALPLAGIASIIGLVASIATAITVPAVVKRIGKRRAFIGGASIGLIGNLVIITAPFVQIAFIGNFLVGAGVASSLVLLFAMQADTVEYGEWRTGVRAEATAFSVFAFVTKWASSIGGAIGAYVLAWTGYVAGGAEQTATAEIGIRLAYGGFPFLMTLLGLILILTYPLTDAKLGEVLTDLRERRAAGPVDVLTEEGQAR